MLMHNFFAALQSLVAPLPVSTVLEIGCGEGEIGKRIVRFLPSASYYGTDLDPGIVHTASTHHPSLQFGTLSIYDIPSEPVRADLIVASEVFEHLGEPRMAMNALLAADFRYLLLSVPREPVWRLLNCLRGKYLLRGGNTPGHVNHWSRASFVAFLGTFPALKIERVASPFPWTMVLCRKSV